MSDSPTPSTPASDDSAYWASRRQANRRLAWALAGVALAVFFIALWKFRPL